MKEKPPATGEVVFIEAFMVSLVCVGGTVSIVALIVALLEDV